MIKYFDQKYINEEIENSIYNKTVNVLSFVTKSTRELRLDYIADFNISSRSDIFKINYDPISDSFEVNHNEYKLVKEVSLFLEKIKKCDILIVDITNIDIRFLGILLYNLRLKNFDKILCAYITPVEYKKNPNYLGDENEEENQFDLSSNIGKRRGINGFLVDNDNNLLEKNIILLGFEGERTLRLCEEADIDVLLPVITLPAIRPGWQNYAMVENKAILSKVGERSAIEYIAADSIASVYNKMNEWKKIYKNFFLRISPLGTKVNALGVLLYVLNNPKSYDILYDNPIETGSNSIGVGNYYFYDITEYIRVETK
jgi:hypothetical protein